MSHRHVTVWNETHNNIHDRNQSFTVVIDPMTCMLRIPINHIQKTRAQNRSGLPSLCQLYLNNRCRQGSNCFQIHADYHVVMKLRDEIGKLPRCCMAHGDTDRIGLFNPGTRELPLDLSNDKDNTKMDGTPGNDSGETRSITYTPQYALEDMVLYIPGYFMNSGYKNDADDGSSYIPIKYCSYTLALRRLLAEVDMLETPPLRTIKNGDKPKVVLDASNTILCRMHVMDRCLYAEECKFLHLCKRIVFINPNSIHTIGISVDHRQFNKSPCNIHYPHSHHHYNTAFPMPYADDMHFNFVNQRGWRNSGDTFYPPFPNDAAPKYKEHRHARPYYMWNVDNARPCNTGAYMQESGCDTSPSFSTLRFRQKHFRRLLIPGCRSSEPNNDEATAMARIPPPQHTAPQPSSLTQRVSQPHSIDSCPDTNFTASLSTLVNDKIRVLTDGPTPGTQSGTSDSSKMSHENGHKNESNTSLFNFSGAVSFGLPRDPLLEVKTTPSRPPEGFSKSCPEPSQSNDFGLNLPNPLSLDTEGVIRNFQYQNYNKDLTHEPLEKPATQPKNVPCWQHNPYTGVMLNGINLFCKDSNVMSSNNKKKNNETIPLYVGNF
ncbi:unnamed protein product [Phytomonas sp. Hart1]|nr:unnamed protein product [Phytomonas sp. Hart1]|eukprot:CCW72134.1 unnamed protein product [Phytomonas sp. isolate Hart1]